MKESSVNVGNLKYAIYSFASQTYLGWWPFNHQCRENDDEEGK